MEQFVSPMTADICNDRGEFDHAQHCEVFKEHASGGGGGSARGFGSGSVTKPDGGSDVRQATEGIERQDGPDGEYFIRPYEPADRDGFLALHDQVFDGKGGDWFAWKFEENPYLDHVPIFVAASDGEVVGARPFLAFRMRAGDRTFVALQTCDTMVHPDHRRQGLFTRMTERAFEHYADQEPAFTFNVPNDISRPGYLNLGCEVVSELTTYYRVQSPSSFAGATGALARFAGPVNVLARGYLKGKDRLVDTPEDVAVSRHADVPSKLFATLYQRRPPDAVHAYRDEEFLEYRFGNPEWDYTAYTARLAGTPIAGLVTARRTVEGDTVSNIVDVAPLVGDPERDRGLVALLSRVVDDHADSDVMAFRGPSIPAPILKAFGFKSDQAFPLARVATPTTLIACPLPVPGSWRINARDLRDVSTWFPTFVEQNTS